MRFYKFLFPVLVMVASTWPTAAETWLSDFGAAKLRVAAENKPLLMLFTGSDWCPACQRLQKDVLSTAEFRSYAEANLTLLMVDFPRSRILPAAQKNANENLAREYKVTAFPTMIMLDTRGQEFAHVRYGGDSVQSFLKVLDHFARQASPAGTRRDSRGAPIAQEASPLFNGAPPGGPVRYKDLLLKSISGSGGRRLALINNQTLSPGESARVKMEEGEVRIRCLEIREQSVLVAVEGHSQPRELRLPSRQ